MNQGITHTTGFSVLIVAHVGRSGDYVGRRDDEKEETKTFEKRENKEMRKPIERRAQSGIISSEKWFSLH